MHYMHYDWVYYFGKSVTLNDECTDDRGALRLIMYLAMCNGVIQGCNSILYWVEVITIIAL